MADATRTELLEEVSRYYSARLAEHGPCARGVDWNGEPGQLLRFEQLMRVVQGSDAYSINDFGCGYGALLDFLGSRHGLFQYTGCDVSAAMIEAARARHGADPRARFVHGSRPPEAVDYSVASGLFNVRLQHSTDAWHAYLIDTLDLLHECSRLGFAFNCLTSYSDAERMRPDLHYADPCALFDLCKRRYSRHVTLLHDYDLYEFTMLVRMER